MPEAFYERTDDGWRPTELTRGPWDPDFQHAGPPSALIGRAFERLASPAGPDADWQVSRITLEILRAVPIAPLALRAEVERSGRSVEMLSASLADAEGEVLRARAWRIARGEVELPSGLASEEAQSPIRRGREVPGPETASPEPFFPAGYDVGYHTGMEYRFVAGRFVEPGPATVWGRMRHPLVAGEEATPLQRVLIAADSGNGVSSTLDWSQYLFVNVDLSVHLHRMPAGEWICLDAITVPEPTRVGLADTMLLDQRGPIGRALQTLLVRER